MNEDIGEQFVVSKEFLKGKNLQSSAKCELKYEKLKRGRCDLWIMPGWSRCTFRVRQVQTESYTGSGDTLARIGGEVFAILLPSTNADDACKVAERGR